MEIVADMINKPLVDIIIRVQESVTQSLLQDRAEVAHDRLYFILLEHSCTYVTNTTQLLPLHVSTYQ